MTSTPDNQKQLIRTLRFLQNAAEDGTALFSIHARRVTGNQAATVMASGVEALRRIDQASRASLRALSSRLRFRRALTRHASSLWGRVTAKAGTPFMLDMESHVLRKLSLVSRRVSELMPVSGDDSAAYVDLSSQLIQIADRANAIAGDLRAAAAQTD